MHSIKNKTAITSKLHIYKPRVLFKKIKDSHFGIISNLGLVKHCTIVAPEAIRPEIKQHNYITWQVNQSVAKMSKAMPRLTLIHDQNL